jgi:hypothetical protein
VNFSARFVEHLDPEIAVLDQMLVAKNDAQSVLSVR